MKYFLLLFALFLLVLFLSTACNPVPQACIAIQENKTRVQKGESLHFLSTCNTPDCTISWTIKQPFEEIKINRQSVRYRFQGSGMHEIHLQVSNSKGSSTSRMLVEVLE